MLVERVTVKPSNRRAASDAGGRWGPPVFRHRDPARRTDAFGWLGQQGAVPRASIQHALALNPTRREVSVKLVSIWLYVSIHHQEKILLFGLRFVVQRVQTIGNINIYRHTQKQPILARPKRDFSIPLTSFLAHPRSRCRHYLFCWCLLQQLKDSVKPAVRVA